MRQQAQREKERVEEGLRLSRERAAEKARIEAAALEKLNREKKELEEKKEVRHSSTSSSACHCCGCACVKGMEAKRCSGTAVVGVIGVRELCVAYQVAMIEGKRWSPPATC